MSWWKNIQQQRTQFKNSGGRRKCIKPGRGWRKKYVQAKKKRHQNNFSRRLTHSHLSTTATFFCPQGGRCGEVKLYMQSKNSPTPARFTFLMYPAYAIVSPLKCSTTFISHPPPLPTNRNGHKNARITP